MNKLNHLSVLEVVSISQVAQWLGTTSGAAGNWLHRYDDLPRPLVRQQTATGWHYLWPADSRQQWLQWAKAHEVWALSEGAA